MSEYIKKKNKTKESRTKDKKPSPPLAVVVMQLIACLYEEKNTPGRQEEETRTADMTTDITLH